MQQQLETGKRDRRRIVAKAGVILLAVIVALTFLSRSVESYLMPKVTLTSVSKGSLYNTFNTSGLTEYTSKEKVKAGGTWKVTKVTVYTGQDVKKGDVLAEIDNNDIKADLKRMDMELAGLVNDLDSFKSNYETMLVPSGERDVELAQKAVKDAEKNVSDTKELYENTLATENDLKNAEQAYQDRLYDLKARQNSLKATKEAYASGLKARTDALELKRIDYEKNTAGMPLDGLLKSDTDGTVFSVNIEDGDTVMQGQEIMDIVPANSPLRVSWYIESGKADKYPAGSEVIIEATGATISPKDEKKSDSDSGSGSSGSDSDNESGNGSDSYDDSGVIGGDTDSESDSMTINEKINVTGKEYSQSTGNYRYWADIYPDRLKEFGIKIRDGATVTIWGNRSSQEYECIVPKSCIFEESDGSYIYDTTEVDGMLGKQLKVLKQKVEVADSDGFNAALKGGFYSMSGYIVATTTKPLSNGMAVRKMQ